MIYHRLLALDDWPSMIYHRLLALDDWPSMIYRRLLALDDLPSRIYPRRLASAVQYGAVKHATPPPSLTAYNIIIVHVSLLQVKDTIVQAFHNCFMHPFLLLTIHGSHFDNPICACLGDAETFEPRSANIYALTWSIQY